MKYAVRLWALWAGAALALAAREPEKTPLDEYVEEASGRTAWRRASPGSIYSEAGLLGDIAVDLRARRLDDIVTIVVADRASALTRGATSSSRKSAARSSVAALGGVTRAAGPLANLADLGGQQQLQGEGETSRETALTTTISARVVAVLPNGNLVVEGTKDIWINAERQQVTVRGIVRWNDLDGRNRVGSDRLAHLEIRVNGKGVVGDAVRRPNFLYRLLLGLVPF
jgi:flagellar L-ring protein precursor FlgH